MEWWYGVSTERVSTCSALTCYLTSLQHKRVFFSPLSWTTISAFHPHRPSLSPKFGQRFHINLILRPNIWSRRCSKSWPATIRDKGTCCEKRSSSLRNLFDWKTEEPKSRWFLMAHDRLCTPSTSQDYNKNMNLDPPGWLRNQVSNSKLAAQNSKTKEVGSGKEVVVGWWELMRGQCTSSNQRCNAQTMALRGS